MHDKYGIALYSYAYVRFIISLCKTLLASLGLVWFGTDIIVIIAA